MGSVPVVATLALGFLLGLRHALDADHIAAVATLARGDGVRRALGNGMSWGFGHAAALAVAGGAALAARHAIPPRLVAWFELLAALMLIGLGAAALRAALRERLHVHEHRHDDLSHAHLHFHAARHTGNEAPAHRHPHAPGLALRPFLVGSVHGLAGSGALSLVVLATVPTVLAGTIYILVFGAGSTLGMMLMSVLIGAPLALARRRAERAARGLRLAAGAGSVLFGAALAWTAFPF